MRFGTSDFIPMRNLGSPLRMSPAPSSSTPSTPTYPSFLQTRQMAPRLGPLGQAMWAESTQATTPQPPLSGPVWGNSQQPSWITVGKRQVPNPFIRPPRTGFGDWETDIASLRQQRLDPRQLFRLQVDPIMAQARSDEQAVAEDVARQRLGPAFMSQYRARQGQNVSSLLGQAAGSSAVDAATANQGLYTALLNAALGRAGVESGERGQDIDQMLGWLNYWGGLGR